MTSTSSNNKRIAKNTMMLYFRMLLLMLVSLYTSRVNLNALGVVDYGIYGVVGGLVGMFWIISNALVSSINRFLTYEIGTGNQQRLNKIFSTAVGIQYIIVAIIVVLAETVGLWFLNCKMVIPPDRIAAANWVYQFSLVSFCMDLVVIPYTADIIAHEKMSAFAYISILTAVGKLIVAWSIAIAPIDRLVWFAVLILVNATIIRFIYVIYCRRHFEECRGKLQFDKTVWKEMFGFAGWTFIGTIAAILRDYGGNIIINLFAGPAVNAARGIAGQVNGAVAGFTDNFQTALKPQITKNYATGNFDYMFSLIFQGARLSFYILFILTLPILCSTH
ncbi:MAG: oligosaccharide flippase family protein, partial [Muribaculaceae bacterium]|nr:oligosaccharide flippase family protein [Muribaculaceae bacterium]